VTGPHVGIVTEDDVRDFILGTNLLSGAGGAPNEAVEHLLETLSEGYEIGWRSVDSLADDALVIAGYYVGSVDPDVWRDRAARAVGLGLEQQIRRPVVRAIERFEQRLGRPVDAIISIEIGASNTAAALDAGVRLGRPVLDADYAGRAIPAFDCTLPAIAGKLAGPVILADYYGDVVEVTDFANVGRLEAIGKMVAKATLGRIGSAGLPLSGREVKAVAARGTLSESLQAGRALRRAREAGGDVVADLVAGLPRSSYLFRGRLDATEWDNADGYMTGYHRISGLDCWRGHELKIYFQNENHLAWLDDSPLAMSPDIIELVDANTAEPLVNTFIEAGQQLAVLGLLRPDALSTPAAIAALGPARWGFEIPFSPLESSQRPSSTS
jgi:DUF917 family protein